MARLSRLGIARTAAVALALLLTRDVARGTEPDLEAFIGLWTFGPGSTDMLDCGGVIGAHPTDLVGTKASIYKNDDPKLPPSDLVFELGCQCRIALDVVGASAKIVAAPQTCLIVNQAVAVKGQVEELTLDLTELGSLTFTLKGKDATITLFENCVPSPFSGTGQLSRTDAGPNRVTCGAKETWVGVMPYGAVGTTHCKLGAGREGLWIMMHDEERTACSAEAGVRGEGGWLLPDDNRDRPPRCTTPKFNTNLDYCRVDGARFASMTMGTDPNQFYAVLKLGDVCPNGSIEISKTIDNEDLPTDWQSQAVGDLGPNTVFTTTGGTVTTLVFCYFRGARPGDPTMTEFPDLGFPYAVFHRYADEQPPWVIAKSWIHSDDEDGPNSKNAYHLLREDLAPTIIEDFRSVVENTSDDTTFNLARVR